MTTKTPKNKLIRTSFGGLREIASCLELSTLNSAEEFLSNKKKGSLEKLTNMLRKNEQRASIYTRNSAVYTVENKDLMLRITQDLEDNLFLKNLPVVDPPEKGTEYIDHKLFENWRFYGASKKDSLKDIDEIAYIVPKTKENNKLIERIRNEIQPINLSSLKRKGILESDRSFHLSFIRIPSELLIQGKRKIQDVYGEDIVKLFQNLTNDKIYEWYKLSKNHKKDELCLTLPEIAFKFRGSKNTSVSNICLIGFPRVSEITLKTAPSAINNSYHYVYAQPKKDFNLKLYNKRLNKMHSGSIYDDPLMCEQEKEIFKFVFNIGKYNPKL